MKLRIERPVTVITPTTGSAKLTDALVSVQNQTYKNIQHLIVIDGPKFSQALVDNNDIRHIEYNNVVVQTLHENTGAGGLNGQRIYAAFPHLINSDYVFFLDDDNWYEPNHIETMVAKIEQDNLDWAFSFRKIYTPDAKYIADDNCESLGKWPIYFTHDNPQYLIDTSSFGFKREFIQKTCHLWHFGVYACDRVYLANVRDKSKWDTTGLYTMCYRVDNSERSVTADFFNTGNQKQLEFYNGVLPWAKT